MQQQQPPPPQPGGSQFGAPPPEMASFPSSAAGPRAHILGIPGADPHQPPQPAAEAASPISSRPPPSPPEGASRPAATASFDEVGPAVPGGFPDDEALAAGEEAERGGTPGNRWPRQETLALLKIRSEMDAAFRDATFKGPLWEEVSRKLAELGYKRSAKKCKEKFENVHKYYKRTKEGRAGRQDGKTYRFFTQLEALHSSSGGGATTPAATAAPPLTSASPTPFSFTTAMAGPSAARIQPSPISAVAPPPITTPTRVVPELGPQGDSSSAGAAAVAAAAGISFSSNSSSSSSSESDDEETEEAGGSREGRKRKRRRGSRSRRQMMAFFEGLMKQVMERQEAMQRRFLEAIEKREQDRIKREEAWRLQEMTRLSREQELLVQERAIAASRDTAVISYLQKMSGQSIPLPTMPATVAPTSVPPLPPQPSHAPPPPSLPQQAQPSSQQQHEAQHHTQFTDVTRHQPPSVTQLVPIISEPQEGLGSGSFEPTSSSRWPKAEVHALIKLRSGLESRYQEVGPKGPLWEEISAGMRRLGYNRSAKRCKEKWENINKYFKKVKESNKKRPEDSKTCPYFHELDALYRKKLVNSGGGGGGSSAGVQEEQVQDTNLCPISQEQHQQQPPTEAQGKSGNNNGNRNGGNSEAGGGSTGVQVQTSNGGHPPSFFEEGMKKPEDIVKELMERRQHQGVMDDYDKMDEPDSDNLDQDDDDDDDDEDDEDSKMQYEIQFQRQNMSGGGGNASTTTAAATSAAGSFLAMVQ